MTADTTERIQIVRDRLRRDAVELIVLILAFGLLQGMGFLASTPLAVFAGLGLATTVAGTAAHAVWPGHGAPHHMHFRLAVQIVPMMALLYSTGWGAGLVVVLAFYVADTVRSYGSQAVWSVVGWCVGAVAVAQAAVAGGIAPSLVPLPEVHALAVLGMLGLMLVSHRIRRMARAKEEAENAVAARERQFRMLVQNSTDVITVLDRHGRFSYLSDSAHTIFGYEPDELLERPFIAQVHPDDQEEMRRFAVEVASRPGSMSLVACRMRHADGSWRHVESVGTNLLHDPEVEGWVLNTRDVTERRVLEEQLAHRAFHDSLTNLANRALFTDRVEHAVARQSRRNEPVSVLFLDLDGFKNVNDTLGHGPGDELLQRVAERLYGCARDVDTVARLGGDEFAILIEDSRDESGAARVAERILTALSEPFDIGGKAVSISASIGIAVSDLDEKEKAGAQDLLRNADIAMYMAKGSGKACYEIFEPSMHLAVVRRLEMEADLQRAVEQQEFVLHYQPIVQLDNGGIVGVEALVRWNHPEKGTVPPNDFIPIAEDTGLIVPLGKWVLDTACMQAAEWQRSYPTRPPLHISVNLSTRQLTHPDIIEHVTSALRLSGLHPETLTLEITETALVQDTELTITRLKALKTLGVRLAIDDFGTGYSSLSYLQRFPVDVLKIDRSFIDSLDKDSNPALVRSIVELGNSLKLDTVAEGIERNEQLTQFRALHCRHGQGYFFARPASSQDISLLFAQQGIAGKPLVEMARKVDEGVIDLTRRR
jgi:diguanylate cyclase (GGDEF)-like protein/PAS domain S-box-containing protein